MYALVLRKTMHKIAEPKVDCVHLLPNELLVLTLSALLPRSHGTGNLEIHSSASYVHASLSRKGKGEQTSKLSIKTSSLTALKSQVSLEEEDLSNELKFNGLWNKRHK